MSNYVNFLIYRGYPNEGAIDSNEIISNFYYNPANFKGFQTQSMNDFSQYVGEKLG